MSKHQMVILTDVEMERFDDGQDWYKLGDDVRLEGYDDSDMLDLTVNGYTHDNWISRSDLDSEILERLSNG